MAGGCMIFQIGLLRELRFQLNTLFTLAPFLFSSVIFFLGLGSLAARWVEASLHRVLRRGVALLPLLLVPAFAASIALATVFTPLQPMQVTGEAYLGSVIRAFVAVSLVGFGPVFVLQGLLFALYFREGRRTGVLSQVYAVDLLASAVGALLGGVLIYVLTPVQMVLVASGVLLVNLWVAGRHLGISLAVIVLETLLVAAVAVVEVRSGPLAALEAWRWAGETLHYSAWSPYRRIDVVEQGDALFVHTDGLPFHVYYRGSDPSKEIRALPVLLLPPPDWEPRRVLIVGSGTGADVRLMRILRPDRVRLVAVEIDRGFIDTARLIPSLWQHYATAEIVIREGRYYVENTDETFDMVVYAYVDPQSAISKIGLPDANFLYTDAGLRAAWSRVEEGGYLVITRVYLEEQHDRFVGRLCATLEAAGIDASHTGLYRQKDSFPWGYYGRLAVVHVVARKGRTPPPLEPLGLVPLEWRAEGRPTTDLFPFSLVTRVWFATLADFLAGRAVTLAILVLLLLALLARLVTSLGHLNFFVLGFGSFLVESLVLYNSFLLFGNPGLSAAFAVGVFLLWNGLGSLVSDRLQRLRLLHVLVPAVVLLYSVSAPLLNRYTLALPVPVRLAAFTAHLSLAGVAVGAMFPISLRLFRRERVASMFFIDLIGCSLAPVGFWMLMSLQGAGAVMAAGVLCYAAVGVILRSRT
jgi:hypothetical protein